MHASEVCSEISFHQKVPYCNQQPEEERKLLACSLQTVTQPQKKNQTLHTASATPLHVVWLNFFFNLDYFKQIILPFFCQLV